MPLIRSLFAFEVAVNAVSGPLMVFAPRLALGALLGGEERVGEEAAEVARWFGCMIFAFGAVLLGRALRRGARAPAELRRVLVAFLVGDVSYTACSASWAWRKGYWTAAAVFNVAFSAALLLARCAAIGDIRRALPGGSAAESKARRGD
jgi:hypothetical protein